MEKLIIVLNHSDVTGGFMKLDRENMKKLKELILFTIVILIALWNYRIIFGWIRFGAGIVFPFLLGGGIAFVLNVPMRFLEKKIFGSRYLKGKKAAERIARPVSLILTLAIVIGVIVLVMFVVIPELTNTVLSLGNTVRFFVPQAQKFLEELFTNNRELRVWVESFNLDVGKLVDSAVSFFKNDAGNVLNSTFSAIGSIVSGVASFAIAFVFACYILLQKEKLRIQVQKVLYAFLSENKVGWIFEVCALTSKSFSSFLTGQCVEALILGAMFFVVLSIFNMPYTLLISVLISFLSLIPIFGAFIGCLVGAFLILMTDPVKMLVFVGIFLVLQQIEGNLIYPKVVGNSVGLPSIWVLAAVTVGGSLMGIVGMLVFIPVVSVIYTLLRASVHKRLMKKFTDGHIQNPRESGQDEKANERIPY